MMMTILYKFVLRPEISSDIPHLAAEVISIRHLAAEIISIQDGSRL